MNTQSTRVRDTAPVMRAPDRRGVRSADTVRWMHQPQTVHIAGADPAACEELARRRAITARFPQSCAHCASGSHGAVTCRFVPLRLRHRMQRRSPVQPQLRQYCPSAKARASELYRTPSGADHSIRGRRVSASQPLPHRRPQRMQPPTTPSQSSARPRRSIRRSRS